MTDGEKFIQLLGAYAAHESASNRAMFHERMERFVIELGIPPIEFTHGMESEILRLFDLSNDRWTNVFICGEAGVGKTRMIHKVQREVFGNTSHLRKGHTCWEQEGVSLQGTPYRAYINRDLSASRKFGAENSLAHEADQINLFSSLILGNAAPDGVATFFIVAANDGQLLSAWKDHAKNNVEAERALRIIEHALQSDGLPPNGEPLRLFHLSSLRAPEIFEGCLDSLLNHPGWKSLEDHHSGPSDIYSSASHLRRSRNALVNPVIRERLLNLIRLCEANDWHFPVRNMLAFLANAILGTTNHRISPSGVMNLDQLRALSSESQAHGGDFFSSILGLNLQSDWREKTLGPLESFRVGYETWNVADNLILFGPDDEEFVADHKTLFGNDPNSSDDEDFERIRLSYLSAGPSEDPDNPFHEQLVAQRRKLFFRIPADYVEQYDPWRLTNFHHAQEYLTSFLGPANAGQAPNSREIRDLVLGLNRVWTGLLLEEDDELFLATALDYASSASCEIEVKRIPTSSASGGEPPCVALEAPPARGFLPLLTVRLSRDQPPISMRITLTRFEFLKRVAAGAMPASFSRECSEDIRAFKSRILARLVVPTGGSLNLLRVDNSGHATSLRLKLSSY